MANVIQIKRGPEGEAFLGDGVLSEYELGFGTDHSRLYIGKKEGQLTTDLVKSIPIGADLRNGLPVELGGTGATSPKEALTNLAEKGGTLQGAIVMGDNATFQGRVVMGEKDADKELEAGIFVLSSASYGEDDPVANSETLEGQIYFKLITE
jgi:hypothetical protein